MLFVRLSKKYFLPGKKLRSLNRDLAELNGIQAQKKRKTQRLILLTQLGDGFLSVVLGPIL